MGIRTFHYCNKGSPVQDWLLEYKLQDAQQLRSVRCDKAGKLERRLA